MSKVSKEELEAFWRGDKNTYQKMYSQRIQQKANQAEQQGKQVTYVPNDGSGTLPEVVATAPKETEELKQVRLNKDYENLADNAITVAGFVPGLDTVADIADIGNSWRKGDYSGMLWGLAGLGLPISGRRLKLIFYYVPKTKKLLKQGLNKALKQGKITEEEFNHLSKLKIKTNWDNESFMNLGGEGIMIAPGYKGLDGGFSLFHELGHEIEVLRSKKSPDFLDELSRTYALYGKDYNYANVKDLDRLLSELFADRFGFGLAGSKSLNFKNDALSSDLVNRFKHYLNTINYDEDYFKALDQGNFKDAEELRKLHFLYKSELPTLTNLYRGTKNTTRTSFSKMIEDPEVGTMYGIYFTPNKKYAKEYGKVLSFYGLGNNPLLTTGSWTGVIDLEKYNGIINLGYDHVINVNFDKSWFRKRPETIMFNPNNIKLSDVITYDDNNEIIPLSKRDNFKINDIRFKKGGKL